MRYGEFEKHLKISAFHNENIISVYGKFVKRIKKRYMVFIILSEKSLRSLVKTPQTYLLLSEQCHDSL